MRPRYTDIRDKTFIMLTDLDPDQQEAYALSIQNYIDNPDDYAEMTEYLNLFNREGGLVAFMNNSVSDADVVNYDDKLHPSLLETRNRLDEMSLSNSGENQNMARRLAFFLLADMKDDFDWHMAGTQKKQGYNDEGGGSNHSADSFDMM